MECAPVQPYHMNYPRRLTWIPPLLALAALLLLRSQKPSLPAPSGADTRLPSTEASASPSQLLSPAASGRQPSPPAMADFREWMSRYRSAGSPDARQALQSEGVTLAKARLTAMADLVQLDPARAFEEAASYEDRKSLPPALQQLLEQPINGVGDLSVLGIVQSPGASSGLPPVMRSVKPS